MLCWFDSHCHFDFSVFDSERDAIWQHCKSLNIGGMIIPGVSRQQSDVATALVPGWPWYLGFGLHPYFLQQHAPQDWQWLENRVHAESGQNVVKEYSEGESTTGAPVAVGECGLHFTRTTSGPERTQQQALFEFQVALARDNNLPMILHGVGAHDQIAATLNRMNCHTGGVVHAFSGSYQQACRYLDMGLRLGIGATFFHANAHKLRRTLAALPREAVLIETDAPDMVAPFWSGLYGPQAIPMIALGLSSLWRIPLYELQQQLWLNLMASFPLIAVQHTRNWSNDEAACLRLD